jgi:FAD:protein FMN transferase
VQRYVAGLVDDSMISIRLYGTIAFASLVALIAIGCRPTPLPAHQLLSGQTMGTSYSVTLVPFDAMPKLNEVSERIDRELAQVNQQMSTYLQSSELSRFNASETLDWFAVSRETAEVVQLALQISEQTDGAFDVTVGPLVDLWGFGPTRRPGNHDEHPSDEAIAEALKSVGSDKLAVRLDPPALRKSAAALHVDLSAIAKGHGVDRLAVLLASLGFQNYFVEIGGEVRTRGRRLDGRSWRVGIEKPVENERAIQSIVEISDRALATSGDYRNFYEQAGQRYSHFINPKTGRPIKDPIASASVIADNCALADAVATGLMSAGFEKAQELATANGWTIMIIARRAGGFETKTSPQFDDLLIDPAKPQ